MLICHGVLLTCSSPRKTCVMRHVPVVDDDREVVGRDAVGADDDEVVDLVVGDGDRALDHVVPGDDAALRVAKADHRRDALGHRRQRLARLGAPAAVVERLLAARALRLAHRLELGRRRVAAVGAARGEHPRRRPRRSGRGAASGRPDPRHDRDRASAATPRSARPTPRSSGRRRCPRCAGRSRRRWWRANAHENSAVRAVPRCRKPVGDGAIRVRTRCPGATRGGACGALTGPPGRARGRPGCPRRRRGPSPPGSSPA